MPQDLKIYPDDFPGIPKTREDLLFDWFRVIPDTGLKFKVLPGYFIGQRLIQRSADERNGVIPGEGSWYIWLSDNDGVTLNVTRTDDDSPDGNAVVLAKVTASARFIVDILDYRPIFFLRPVGLPAVLRPYNISPADESESNNPPTLVASDYFSLYGKIHTSSEWQVSVSPSFASTVIDSGVTAPTVIFPIALNALVESAVYYWRVRYTDEDGVPSEWSRPTSFSLGAYFVPDRPTNESPEDGASEQGFNNAPIILQASDYTSQSGLGMLASQWQVSLSSDFSTLSIATGDRPGLSTNYTIGNPFTSLQQSSIYFWRVRYKDINGFYSPWSLPTSFTLSSIEATRPARPTNVSPPDNATDLGESIPSIGFTASAYSSPVDSPMATSQWQVSRFDNFSTIVYDTSNIAGVAVSHTLENPFTVLAIETSYFWRVRYQDANSRYSDWSVPTTFTTGVNLANRPQRPVNVSPPNNAAGLGASRAAIVLAASDYFSPAGLAGQFSQWQVALAADTGFVNPIVSSGDLSGIPETFSITDPSQVMSVGTPYRWRVRYKDVSGLVSEWSDPTVFTTSSSFEFAPPATPINQLPANGAVNQGVGGSAIELTASAYFSSEGAGMTHSQWQVTLSSDTGFASPAITTGDVVGVSTSRAISNPSASLSVSTVYRWRVRYKDSNGVYSAWSASTTFTTASSFVFLPSPNTPVNQSPVNGATNIGFNATGLSLSASAYSHPSGTAMSASQWQVTPLTDATFSSPAISTGDSLGTATTRVFSDLSALVVSTNYHWRVRYKDANGLYSSWSTPTSFETASGFGAALPPTISSQPQSQSVLEGDSLLFAVVAAGTAPLSYQWKKNGVNISGATSATYAKTSVLSDAGLYSVLVSNPYGNALSAEATAIVGTAPVISTQPSSQNIPIGGSVTFSVVASGTAPFSYQWRKGGTNISGATSASFTDGDVQSGDAGAYSVVVSNAFGTATSNDATLVVGTAPAITTQPSLKHIIIGQSATFSVVATGTAPLSYRWRKNGTAISGATASTYTATNVQSSGSGNYTVDVTNAFGSITSNGAQLSVYPPAQSFIYGGGVNDDFAYTGQNVAKTKYRDSPSIASAQISNPDISGADRSSQYDLFYYVDGQDPGVSLTNYFRVAEGGLYNITARFIRKNAPGLVDPSAETGVLALTLLEEVLVTMSIPGTIEVKFFNEYELVIPITYSEPGAPEVRITNYRLDSPFDLPPDGRNESQIYDTGSGSGRFTLDPRNTPVGSLLWDLSLILNDYETGFAYSFPIPNRRFILTRVEAQVGELLDFNEANHYSETHAYYLGVISNQYVGLLPLSSQTTVEYAGAGSNPTLEEHQLIYSLSGILGGQASSELHWIGGQGGTQAFDYATGQVVGTVITALHKRRNVIRLPIQTQ